MNKILVEISVGELFDKISILEIKKDKIKDKDNLRFIEDEYKVLNDQLNQKIKSNSKLDELFVALKNVNISFLSKNTGFPFPMNVRPLNSIFTFTPFGKVRVPCPSLLSSLYSPTYFSPFGKVRVPCPFIL